MKNEDEGKALEEQRFQTRKMNAIGRMAGGIAHDFNNILGAIEGYATLILNGMAADDPVRPDIEEILKAERRAAAFTKQLMTISRKHSARKTAVELTGFVSELKQTASPLMGEGVLIQVSASPDIKPVEAEAVLLEQALINLLINARDDMPAGGTIKLTAVNANLAETERNCPETVEPGRQFVKISVEDTGSGMSKDTLEHIFEPFFTTKPKGKGAGLGLAAVYGIVRQHNGWIEVKSEVNGGSAFTIYLPAAPDTGAAAT